ncbi:ABC transporter substrate-binding protein [Pleionea sediminis]|uniref:ABC transporter substrate-binding protein n=1 Tax=Pleionea sediminis TaxID=2569479 RepID=UPI001186D063|nr:ABC transporter substrate-binding protein [Pleionea sediminis]
MKRIINAVISIIFLLSCLSTGAMHKNQHSKELTTLSIKELMNIPLDVNYTKERIFQSDINPVSESSVNFGILAPISSFPIYSAEIIAAADLAAEHINNHGGINGQRLAIIRADDQENTHVSADLADILVKRHNVKAIVGPATSDSVADVLERVAIPKNIPLITQAASAMKLSDIGGKHLFWRMVANNQQQIDLIFNYLYTKEQHKKIFIIGGRDIYSKEIIHGLKVHYGNTKNAQSDHLAISKLVYLDGMNLEDEIRAIQSKNVTAIVLTLPTDQMLAIIKKIRRYWQGSFPLILAADTVKPKYIIDANLGEISHCILTYVSSPTELSPDLRDRVIALLNRDSAGFDAAYVYDAIILFSMAKALSDKFDLDFKKTMLRLTSNGYPISHFDYPDIVALYKKYGSFKYSGYSGRINFNNQGDNLTANMKIYPISQKEHKNYPCMEKQ